MPTTEEKAKSAIDSVLSAKNNYDALGVAPDADTATIERAYKDKSRFAHPDKVARTNDTSLIAQAHQAQGLLSDARKTLMDANSRAEYDKKLAAEKNQGMALNNVEAKTTASDKADEKDEDEKDEENAQEAKENKPKSFLMMNPIEGEDLMMTVFKELNNMVQAAHPQFQEWALGKAKDAYEKLSTYASAAKDKASEFFAKKPDTPQQAPAPVPAATQKLPAFMGMLADGGNAQELAQATMNSSSAPAVTPAVKANAAKPTEDAGLVEEDLADSEKNLKT